MRPKNDCRSITCQDYEVAPQLAREIAKINISMKLRKRAEMLFAHLINRILGLGGLKLRGTCGANDEFLLAATAQNLQKLAQIFRALQQTRKTKQERRSHYVHAFTYCVSNTLFFNRSGGKPTSLREQYAWQLKIDCYGDSRTLRRQFHKVI